MKTQISSMDLYFLTQELQALIEARVDKIYEQTENKKEFLFIFYIPGKGKKMLRVLLPNFIYFTEYKQDFPEQPFGFCMFLRKYLLNSRVKEIKQKGFERILEIKLETKEQKFILIIELFSKGNMVLCKDDYTIMNPLETQNWESRTIRGGIKYEFPPEQKNIFEISESEFIEAVKKSNKDSIVKTLAADFGMGSVYAEELCSIADVDKNKKDYSKVFDAINKLKKQKIKANVSGQEILPIELKSLNAEKFYENFSKALDENLSSKTIERHEKGQKKKSTQLEKLKIILEEQEKKIKEFEEGHEENQKKASFIYEHYSEINEILDAIKEARKKYSWAEIKEKTKEHKIIKEINEKTGEIILNFK